MMDQAQRAAERVARGESVRIGPASLFTLVIIVCLAVLAVLAASTANATLVMSQRMGTANQEFYLDDAAGQVLLAEIDQALAGARDGDEAARAVGAALPGICSRAEESAGGKASVDASFEGRRVNAEITCHNGRVLKITVALLDDATYRIDRWKMTAVQNEEQPTGSLWTGA